MADNTDGTQIQHFPTSFLTTSPVCPQYRDLTGYFLNPAAQFSTTVNGAGAPGLAPTAARVRPSAPISPETETPPGHWKSGLGDPGWNTEWW